MGLERVRNGFINMNDHEFVEAVNVKPVKFSAEREYRIVLHGNNDMHVANDSPSIDLKSDKIGQSIVAIGEYSTDM